MVNSNSDLPKVTVVIPTYNEAETLPDTVERIMYLCVHLDVTVLIVDDDSPDGTIHVVSQLARLYPGRIRVRLREGKMGLASAYADGFKYALKYMDSDYYVQMDADGSHDPKYIPEMIDVCMNVGGCDTDIVVGSRYIEGGKLDESWNWKRRAMSRTANAIIRRSLNLKVKDATSGFKVYTRAALERLNFDAVRCKGFGFQAEIAVQAQELGMLVVEYPITFYDRTKGESKMSFGIVREVVRELILP